MYCLLKAEIPDGKLFDDNLILIGLVSLICFIVGIFSFLGNLFSSRSFDRKINILLEENQVMLLIFSVIIITAIIDLFRKGAIAKETQRRDLIKKEITQLNNKLQSIKQDLKTFDDLFRNLNDDSKSLVYTKQSVVHYGIAKTYMPKNAQKAPQVMKTPAPKLATPQTQNIDSANYLMIACTPELKSHMKSVLGEIMNWIKRVKASTKKDYFSLTSLGPNAKVMGAISVHDLKPSAFKINPSYSLDSELKKVHNHVVLHHKGKVSTIRIFIISQSDPAKLDLPTLKNLLNMAGSNQIELYWFSDQQNSNLYKQLSAYQAPLNKFSSLIKGL